MKEEKLELTEKELHCIARHLQNEVMEMVFRGNREAPHHVKFAITCKNVRRFYLYVSFFY